MKRASYSCCNLSLRCACCYLLEVSPVSLVVLAIRLALFFIVTHTVRVSILVVHIFVLVLNECTDTLVDILKMKFVDFKF